MSSDCYSTSSSTWEIPDNINDQITELNKKIQELTRNLAQKQEGKITELNKKIQELTRNHAEKQEGNDNENQNQQQGLARQSRGLSPRSQQQQPQQNTAPPRADRPQYQHVRAQESCALWPLWVFMSIIILLVAFFGSFFYEKMKGMEMEHARVMAETRTNASLTEIKLEHDRALREAEAREAEAQRWKIEMERDEKQQALRSVILSEPERQMRVDVSRITEKPPDMTVLDKIQTDSLSVYAQVAISECAKTDLEPTLKLHLSDLPPEVRDHIALVGAGTSTKTIYAERKFLSNDSNGKGHYFDVKLLVNVTDDGRASFAARASGTSFTVKDVVKDYKEERTAIKGTRRKKGELVKAANCYSHTSTKGGGRCQFPFQYDGMEFKACTNHPNKDYSWCATATRNSIMASWDYCDEEVKIPGCAPTSKEHGAEFESLEEEYIIGHETKQHPIFDRRVLPESVSQEQVMDALAYRAAKQLS